MSVSNEEKLHIDVDNDPESGRYTYFLHASGADYLDMIPPPQALQELTAEEGEIRHQKLAAYQASIAAFTEYLKQKM